MERKLVPGVVAHGKAAPRGLCFGTLLDSVGRIYQIPIDAGLSVLNHPLSLDLRENAPNPPSIERASRAYEMVTAPPIARAEWDYKVRCTAAITVPPAHLYVGWGNLSNKA